MARQYANEIGAVFKLTSACTSAGIEELFKSIGCKFLDPNYREDDEGASGASKTGEKIMVQLNWTEKLLAMIKKRKGAAKYN